MILADLADPPDSVRESSSSDSDQASSFWANFATLFDAAPSGMFVVDAGLRLRAVNPRARNVLGVGTEVIGQELEAVLRGVRPRVHADEIVSLFRETLHSGEPCDAADHRVDPSDGRAEHHGWRMHRIGIPRSGFGVACYFQDHSAELRTRQGFEAAQEALRDSEVRYRRLFETAADGILLLDAVTARITDANPYIAELLGYSHAELLGKELWEIGVFSDIAESKAAMQKLQRDHYVRYEDLPLQTKQGRRVELEFVSNVYREGPRDVIQCNIRDVTARKKLELEAREHSAGLLVSDRLKDEFLAMLGHELRNPLAPIRNALHLVRRAPGDESTVRSAAAMMERQVGQMVRLVDDLLDASRISRGKLELRRERVELSSVIYHAVEAARPLADSLRHTLDVVLPAEPVWLDADPSRLAQIVGNLLNNACKFTDAGGRISLHVERVGGDVTIKVRDSGMGFSAGQRVHIFDMFMQADTSLGRPVSGLGIGLPLARRLAEIHGGSLEASSAGLGQGSEFVVRLPAMSKPHTVAPVQPGTPRPRLEVAGRGARILVVDDNRDAAQSLAYLLKLSGFATEVAYDGLAAVSAAATFRPHAVLLDIGLPLLDGYGVATRIRSQPWGKRAVLIALTGWGQDHDRLRSSEAGFDHHLVKPADVDTLLGLLDEVGVHAMEDEKPVA